MKNWNYFHLLLHFMLELFNVGLGLGRIFFCEFWKGILCESSVSKLSVKIDDPQTFFWVVAGGLYNPVTL